MTLKLQEVNFANFGIFFHVMQTYISPTPLRMISLLYYNADTVLMDRSHKKKLDMSNYPAI